MTDLDPFIVQVFGAPPPGLDVYESSQIRNYTIISVSLALAALATLARWIARTISGARLQADDYILIFAAFPLTTVTAAVGILSGKSGGGTHVWSLTRNGMVQGLKLGYAYAFVWSITVSVTKLSIILFYRRTFVVHNNSFKWWLHILIFITTSLVITVIVCMATMCRPLSFFWGRFSDGTRGKCNDDALFLLISGIINGCLDVTLLITPIPMILKLKLSAKKKAGVCGIMLLGCLVCIAAFVRISYLVEYWKTIDKTWVAGDVSAWSSIESSFGVVSACLPVLRPLYLRWRDSYGSSLLSRKVIVGSATGPHGYMKSWGSSGASQKPKGLFTKLSGNSYKDDEIHLTSLATVGVHGVQHGDCDRIVVRSEVEQRESRTE